MAVSYQILQPQTINIYSLFVKTLIAMIVLTRSSYSQDDDHDSDEEIQGIHISVAPPPALPGASNDREASQPSSHTGAGEETLELASIKPEVGGLETVEEGKANEEVTEV